MISLTSVFSDSRNPYYLNNTNLFRIERKAETTSYSDVLNRLNPINHFQFKDNIIGYYDIDNQLSRKVVDPDNNYVVFDDGITTSNEVGSWLLSIDYLKYFQTGQINLHLIHTLNGQIDSVQPVSKETSYSYQVGLSTYIFSFDFINGGDTVDVNYTSSAIGIADHKVPISTPNISVTYLDSDGNDLATEDQFSGMNGLSYEVTPLDISGYILVDGEAVSGKFSTVVYDRELIIYTNQTRGVSYCVEYFKNGTGDVWLLNTRTGATSPRHNVPIGEKYTFTRDDWTSAQIGGVSGGAYVLNSIIQDSNIVYRYKKIAGDVTVSYVDEAENKLSADVIFSGDVGDDYQSEQKEISGYTFKEVKGDTVGKITDLPQTVTYVYSKDAVTGGDVTVSYQDEDGNTIAEDIILSGNIGETYTTEELEIVGYTFKEMKTTKVSGVFTDQAQTITYVYSKDSTPPVIPVDPVEPVDPGDPEDVLPPGITEPIIDKEVEVPVTTEPIEPEKPTVTEIDQPVKLSTTTQVQQTMSETNLPKTAVIGSIGIGSVLILSMLGALLIYRKNKQ